MCVHSIQHFEALCGTYTLGFSALLWCLKLMIKNNINSCSRIISGVFGVQTLSACTCMLCRCNIPYQGFVNKSRGDSSLWIYPLKLAIYMYYPLTKLLKNRERTISTSLPIKKPRKVLEKCSYKRLHVLTIIVYSYLVVLYIQYMGSQLMNPSYGRWMEFMFFEILYFIWREKGLM